MPNHKVGHGGQVIGRKLVGKDCKNGVCIKDINPTDVRIMFEHIGIQCVTKKDTAESLALRQKMDVDPYNQGFDHSIFDLNAIRLCFQVFLMDVL